MTDIALKVEGLGKSYTRGALHHTGTLYDRIATTLRLQKRVPTLAAAGGEDPTFWALRDVSFELKRGEVLGLIGRNGSGKSTLMKLLARITTPTEGRAEVYGRVGALLEVGTGFHPELTGRENIALSGAMLGMTRTEISEATPRIIEFAEVDDFLDTPVKHYSSGMFMRLAFSVSAHLLTEILLVDEILAVGDLTFQLKCYERIRAAVREERTVVFVSHSVEALTDLCDRALVLDHGRARFLGNTQEALDFYMNSILHYEAPPDHQPLAV